MPQIPVIVEPIESEQEVRALGLNVRMVQKVARAAAGARASALDIDVAFTPGMLSHIYGNRHLRLELLPHGWRKGRFNNVESVINDELGIQVVFQNVDIACDANYCPQAISGKGAGSRRLVEAGLQGELWETPSRLAVEVNEVNSKIGVTPVVWAFCVSNDGKRLRAELSKPSNFEGNQFEQFSKRIFLLDEECGTEPGVSVGPSSDDDGDSGFDLEVKVVRK